MHTAFKMISSCQGCDTLSRKEAGRAGHSLILALGVEVGGESEASLGWEWRFSTSPADFLDFVFIYPFCPLWDRILLCSLSLP